MTYTIDTPAYNNRRYGKPWIAEVRDKAFTWGEWFGRPGERGRLEIDAEPGALIATGQKDIRKGRGGVDDYWIAMPNGQLYSRYLESEVAARDWARAGWEAYARKRAVDPEDEKRQDFLEMLGEAPAPRIAMEDFF